MQIINGAIIQKNGDKFFNNSKGESGGKGYHDKGEKSFDSPEQFLSSDYNRTSENKDEIESDAVNNYDFKEAIVLPTSKEQDNIAKDAFIDKTKENYNALSNNCAQAVYSALKAIGINPAVKRSISDSQGMSVNMYTAPVLPQTLFDNLIKTFPDAKIIQK